MVKVSKKKLTLAAKQEKTMKQAENSKNKYRTWKAENHAKEQKEQMFDEVGSKKPKLLQKGEVSRKKKLKWAEIR